MNQSHAELAAQLRILARTTLPATIEGSGRAKERDLVLEAAAALESPERVALTDEQIDGIYRTVWSTVTHSGRLMAFARIIEAAHGIGTSATKEG